MKLLIITSDANLAVDHINELVEPYKKDADHEVTLISVVEPSLVVDMSLSMSGGHSRYKQMLEERLSDAQAQLDEAQSTLEEHNVIDLKSRAVVGSLVPVAVQTATDLKADLVLMQANLASRLQINRLICQCPCSIAFVKSGASPLRKRDPGAA